MIRIASDIDEYILDGKTLKALILTNNHKRVRAVSSCCIDTNFEKTVIDVINKTSNDASFQKILINECKKYE